MKLYAALLLMFTSASVLAQYPSGCASLDARTNGNGQSNSCPNVAGTLYAVNFIGTSYATVPGTAKTGTLTFRYSNALSSLTPYAITKVYSTNPTTTQISVGVGPASVTTLSGLDVLVTYCFYGTNLPNAGVLSFEMSNPQTGVPAKICSFNANCNAGCAIVANPAGLTLPVVLKNFSAKAVGETIAVEWSTEQENNNKGFFVEKSNDGNKFVSLAFIPSSNANGNSSVTTAYRYIDQQPSFIGKAFYRLRQVDLDGKELITSVVDVAAIKKNKVIVAQQAGAIHLSINDVSANSNYNLHIYRADGSLVVTKQLNGERQFVSNHLMAGNYYVQLTDEQGSKKTYPVVVY